MMNRARGGLIQRQGTFKIFRVHLPSQIQLAHVIQTGNPESFCFRLIKGGGKEAYENRNNSDYRSEFDNGEATVRARIPARQQSRRRSRS